MASKDDEPKNPVGIAQRATPQEQVGCVEGIRPVSIPDQGPFKLVQPAISR